MWDHLREDSMIFPQCNDSNGYVGSPQRRFHELPTMQCFQWSCRSLTYNLKCKIGMTSETDVSGFPLTQLRQVTSRRVTSRHVEVLKLFRGGADQLRPGKWKNSVIDLLIKVLF